MGIIVHRDTRVVVQGITGRDGSFHTRQMLKDGTRVVAGVTPGKGGQSVERVPVYNTVVEAVEHEGANTSIIFVPAPFAMDAIIEAADAGVELIVCITEGIPARDMIQVVDYLQDKPTRLIGPNCPGIITPGVTKVGIMPGYIFRPGKVGVVSRSGTLTYEVVYLLTLADMGQSTCLGIGGDPILGTGFIEVLEMFEADPDTEVVVMIGEIGGTEEQDAAEYVSRYMRTPVIGFVAGRTAPPDKRMGHAGAIISGTSGTAREKMEAMYQAGILVADRPADILGLVRKVLWG